MQTETATPARLLQAGRKVFAENGLENARTRDICALARANVAAVNYHFGSKGQLYIKVLSEHIREARERYPLDAGITPGSTPEERLHAYVRGMLQHFLSNDDAYSASLGKLILLEMMQPSQHVGVLIEEHIRPQTELLLSIVSDLLPGTVPAVASRCSASIIVQFVYFLLDRRVLEALGSGFTREEEKLDPLADTIVEFSLGGIERLRARYAS